MTVNQFINRLEAFHKSQKEKEIVIECPNGLLVEPSAKFLLKDEYDVLDHKANNVDKIIITWD